MKKILSVMIALALCLLPAYAAGNSVYISGTVVNTSPIQVNATFSGRVESVSAFVGDYVTEGDEMACLAGTKVYALQDGTVHLFAGAGDSADAATETFGAVAYIEAASPLSISASTQYAYESEENKIIHPGESVYVRAMNNISHVGAGFVTSVSGTNYTVQLTEGNFTAKEAVYIYRDSGYTYNSRIGKGTAARMDPVAYTAEGVVSKVYVEEGTEVKKGDALFETLSGAYAGANAQPGQLTAPADGVVYSMELTRGASVAEGDQTAVIYPDESLRVQANVTEADRVLDAEGCVVAPGFIDAHAHSDTMFLKDDSGASKLFQGITTEISGNCGSSPFPYPDGVTDGSWRCASFGEFLRRFDREQRRMAVNQAMLVGHGSLRESVVGEDDRPATEKELERMRQLLAADLEQGAWGLSLGLEYAPGCFADTRELGFLAKTVKAYDGIVTCHMRSEGLHIDEAIDELAKVGSSSGAHVHISHLKLDNYRVHGRAQEVWERIENARKDGINITADVYPYTASSTTLTIRCPRWSLDGGDGALLERLGGPRRQEIVEGIRWHYPDAARAETCLFSDDGGCWPEIVGKTLREVAENLLGTRDYAEAAAQVIERTRAQAWCVFFVMSEEDMLYFLSRDVSVGSDGRAMSADPAKVGSKPHPRSYGAIAEFFRLAREKRLCTPEEAVNRVTLKTAQRFGITDRGAIAVGKAADITVFDPDTIAPRATYLDPVRTAAGVRHVVVNGGVALENYAQTDWRGGRFLRKNRR